MATIQIERKKERVNMAVPWEHKSTHTVPLAGQEG